MNRALPVLLLLVACGDNAEPRIRYTDPSAAGVLRLVEVAEQSSARRVVLALVVGDQPITAYATGFDLPLVPDRVRLVGFTPGTALDPGTAVRSAVATIPKTGPLANNLVTAQSMQGTADAALAPGTVLYRLELVAFGTAPAGIVFDGMAADFVLPSGGMRDRSGTTVVAAPDVAIGRLVLGPDEL